MASARGRATLEDLLEQLKEGEKTTLNLILKGDVSGSVEALEDALVKIEVSRRGPARIIHRGVGAVTQDDVNLASASDAIIIGFNVRAEGKARELADREGVEIRYYTVIYQAIEEIEAALKGMLKPELRRGRARHGGGPRGLPLVASSATSRAASSGRGSSGATPRPG